MSCLLKAKEKGFWDENKKKKKKRVVARPKRNKRTRAPVFPRCCNQKVPISYIQYDGRREYAMAQKKENKRENYCVYLHHPSGIYFNAIRKKERKRERKNKNKVITYTRCESYVCIRRQRDLAICRGKISRSVFCRTALIEKRQRNQPICSHTM